VGKKVRFLDDQHNLITQVSPNPENDVMYSEKRAFLIAKFMLQINEKITTTGICFGQQFMLHRGLKRFGSRGNDAPSIELKQFHDRQCFTPINIDEITPSERRKAMDALMLLTEKKDGTIKGRMVYNGKGTREWISKHEAASPTAYVESIMITGVIDAKENRDVMTVDVPNAFIQANMPKVKRQSNDEDYRSASGYVDPVGARSIWATCSI